MSLIARIQDELKDAMRDRDNDRRDALRLILSSFSRRRRSFSARSTTRRSSRCFQRERKKRVEAEEAFRTAGRRGAGGRGGLRAGGARGVRA